MDEFEVRNYLRDKRKAVKTKDELFALIEEIENKYNYGYGEAPRAIAQASVAVAEYLLSSMGCTGFQSSCVLWDIIRDLKYNDNLCGIKLLDYDKMLYPQYIDAFSKTITNDTWQTLQNQAKKNLETGYAHPNIIAHWRSIANGKIPFGYTIKEE